MRLDLRKHHLERERDEARAEVRRLRAAECERDEALGVLRQLLDLRHHGPVTSRTPCPCGATQPAHYCYAEEAAWKNARCLASTQEKLTEPRLADTARHQHERQTGAPAQGSGRGQ